MDGASRELGIEGDTETERFACPSGACLGMDPNFKGGCKAIARIEFGRGKRPGKANRKGLNRTLCAKASCGLCSP